MQPTRKIGLFHLDFPCGGSELLTLVLAKALKKNGYRVQLVTTQKIYWPKIQKILGMGKEVIDKESVIPPFIRLRTLYAIFAYWLLRDAIFVPLMKRKLDLTITTTPTLPVVFSDILYIHFPDFIPSYHDQHYPKFSHNGWKVYSIPFRLLCRLSIKAFNALKHKPVVLTNSVYSQRAIEEYLDVKATVVYPPVDTEKYSHASLESRRDNIVFTITRFVESKNVEEVLAVARDAPEATFVILGSAAANSDYPERLMSKARKMGISERISLVVNAGDDDKIRLLSQAKIYLHMMRYEHFGMSIVEAMSAGLVPVVHRSGGPWIDILRETEGDVGYSYSDNREAAGIISQLLRNDSERENLSRKAIERAKTFDSSRFELSMVSIVENVVARRTT